MKPPSFLVAIQENAKWSIKKHCGPSLDVARKVYEEFLAQEKNAVILRVENGVASVYDLGGPYAADETMPADKTTKSEDTPAEARAADNKASN